MKELPPGSQGSKATVTETRRGAGAREFPGEQAPGRSGTHAPAAPPRCPFCLHPVTPAAGGAGMACPECGGSFRLDHAGQPDTFREVRSLGRFQLLREVGRGSFGSVWRARDTELPRDVALKVPHANFLGSPRDVERCLREARAAASLQHPGIVTLHDVVVVGGRPLLVYDFIDGPTLEELLKVRRLTFKEAAGLVAEVADALAYAHSRGVVHRDIKPGNIMMAFTPLAATPATGATPLGRPLVVDFGLALREDAEASMTVEGQLVGTLAYMSSEQAAGKGHGADGRSDVYSLGVVLYELLTGSPPFRGTRFALIHQVVHEEPRPPRRLNDKIHRDLETVCLKAMAKEPRGRYATAGDFAADLRRYLEGKPVLARPVGAVGRVWRWCRRNPAVASLLFLVAVSLLGGMLATSYYAVAASHSADVARANERLALEHAERFRRQTIVNASLLYVDQIEAAQKEWKDGQLALTLKRLNSPVLPGPPFVARGFEWHYLQRLCRTDLATFRGHQGRIRGLAFSADGRLLASAGGDGAVVVRDLARGEEVLRLRGHTREVYAVAFCPRGKRLVSVGGASPGDLSPGPGEVKVWDLATGKEEFSLPWRAGAVMAVAFSPDGRHLACGGGGFKGGRPLPGDLQVWDLEARREEFKVPGLKMTITAVAFSPVGTRLAAAGQDGWVRVWDAARPGAAPVEYGEHAVPGPQAVFCVAFSPDGRRLASAGQDGALWVRDVSGSGGAPFKLPGHAGMVRSVAFSPDGRRLASAGADRDVRVWDLESRAATVLRGHVKAVWAVAFSPDGWRLASAGEDETVRVWDAAGAREPATLTGHGEALLSDSANPVGQVTGAAFNPDGRYLVTSSADRTLKVWDLDLGLAATTWWGHTAHVNGLAFSPDGRHVASAGADRTVRVWTFPAGEPVLTLRGHAGAVWGVAYSPDGKQLASVSGDQTVRVWDAATGLPLRTLRGHKGNVYAVTYSTDGQFLATAGADGKVKVWDSDTGDLWRDLAGHRGAVHGVAFSPVGRQLASCGEDTEVILWNADSGAKLRTLSGHTAQVKGVAFSPDGQRVASAGEDKTVILWFAETGQQLICLNGHPSDIFSVAFSGDGSRLASADKDGRVNVWDSRARESGSSDQPQAIGLLEHLFRKYPSPSEVLARVRGDRTVSEAVRHQAVNLAEPYGRGLVHREACYLLQSLTQKPLLRSDLGEEIRRAPAVTDAVRREALALAGRFVESPAVLDTANREVVRQAGLDPGAYRRALRRAEVVCTLDPDDATYRATLGMALYRLGDYEKAGEALAAAGKLVAYSYENTPARLAFVAMTRAKLGDRRGALESLDQLARRQAGADQPEARSLLAEATEVVSGRSTVGPK